jgi:hypothetical protein
MGLFGIKVYSEREQFTISNKCFKVVLKWVLVTEWNFTNINCFSVLVQIQIVANNYVATAWAEKQGYSKFGKLCRQWKCRMVRLFILGFKPAFLMIKEYSSAG